MSINTILVPTDFSTNAPVAFETACDLARQLHAKLCLLHVRDESVLRIAIKEGLLDAASTDEQLQEAVKKLTEERFAKMLAGLDASDVQIERLSRRGDPEAVIPSYAKQIEADIVVVGSRGAGVIERIRSTVLGSVAESLIRKSPCPVLVVRQEHAQERGGEGEKGRKGEGL